MLLFSKLVLNVVGHGAAFVMGRGVHQWLNLAGISFTGRVAMQPHLAVPHLSLTSVSDLDFDALRRAGAEAVVFDKDNCLTLPYGDSLHPLAKEAWASACRVFGSRALVLSNSAGGPDDPDGSGARALEEQLGVDEGHVVRHHAHRKPACAHQLLAAAGCTDTPHRVVMVGDRLLTDIAMANAAGCMSVLVAPFTVIGDNPAAAVTRAVEINALLPLLRKFGVKPPPHALLQAYKDVAR